MELKELSITKQSVILAVLISCLAVSMGLNVWQFTNVREVEKIVEVPVEVPIEVFVPTGEGPRHFERFLIKGSEHFHVQFYDDLPYEFVHGTLSFTSVTFYGEWDIQVTFRFCEIKNTTFDLTNIDVILENCTVENSYFEGTFDSGVHLNGTTFVGENTFDINVVDRGGNVGFESVQFNGRIFDWE